MQNDLPALALQVLAVQAAGEHKLSCTHPLLAESNACMLVSHLLQLGIQLSCIVQRACRCLAVDMHMMSLHTTISLLHFVCFSLSSSQSISAMRWPIIAQRQSRPQP